MKYLFTFIDRLLYSVLTIIIFSALYICLMIWEFKIIINLDEELGLDDAKRDALDAILFQGSFVKSLNIGFTEEDLDDEKLEDVDIKINGTSISPEAREYVAALTDEQLHDMIKKAEKSLPDHKEWEFDEVHVMSLFPPDVKICTSSVPLNKYIGYELIFVKDFQGEDIPKWSYVKINVV